MYFDRASDAAVCRSASLYFVGLLTTTRIRSNSTASRFVPETHHIDRSFILCVRLSCNTVYSGKLINESISLSSSQSYRRGEIGYVTEVNFIGK